MLIMTENGWKPFVGSKVLAGCTDDYGNRVVTATVPCKNPRAYQDISPGMAGAEDWIVVLRNFLFESSSRFLDPVWQMRKNIWRGI